MIYDENQITGASIGLSVLYVVARPRVLNRHDDSPAVG